MTWLWIIGGVIVFVVILARIGYAEEARERREAPEHLRKARESLQAGDHETALRELGTALFVPIGPDYSAEEAQTSLEAAKFLEEALRGTKSLPSEVGQLRLALEPLAAAGGRHPGDLLRAVKKVLEHPERLAWELRNLPPPAPAASAASEASALQDHANAGAECLLREDFTGAIRHYDVVLGLDPENVEALISRGASYHALREFTAAASDFTHALRINPDQPACYFSRAKGAVERGDLETALRDLNEALRLAPDFEDARELRAKVGERLGR